MGHTCTDANSRISRYRHGNRCADRYKYSFNSAKPCGTLGRVATFYNFISELLRTEVTLGTSKNSVKISIILRDPEIQRYIRLPHVRYFSFFEPRIMFRFEC